MKENNTNEFENNQDEIKAADTADTGASADTVNNAQATQTTSKMTIGSLRQRLRPSAAV